MVLPSWNCLPHHSYNSLEEKPPVYLTLAHLGEKALEARLEWRGGRGIPFPAPPEEEAKIFLAFTERYGPLGFPQTPTNWKNVRAIPEPEPGYESHLERQSAGFPLTEAIDEAIRMAVAGGH